nr:MAG TPA: hypothetical protein [Caudoviricetes sp.]
MLNQNYAYNETAIHAIHKMEYKSILTFHAICTLHVESELCVQRNSNPRNS